MCRLIGSLSLLAGVTLFLAGCTSRHDDQPRLGETDKLPKLETLLPERTSLTVQSELAATVEEITASAESLRDLVSYFRVEDASRDGWGQNGASRRRAADHASAN